MTEDFRGFLSPSTRCWDIASTEPEQFVLTLANLLFNDILQSAVYRIGVLTPCSSVLLEKLTVSQLVKKFPEFYGNRKLHYRVRNCPPPVAVPSQISPLHAPHIQLLEDLF